MMRIVCEIRGGIARRFRRAMPSLIYRKLIRRIERINEYR